MGNIRTFEVAREVIDSQTESLKWKYDVNDNGLKAVKSICSLIDELMEENYGSFFETKVSGAFHDITMKFSVSDVQWARGYGNSLRLLMLSSTSVSFKNGGNDDLIITLKLPGIWEGKTDY